MDLPAPLSLQTELHCWKYMQVSILEQDQLPDSPTAALSDS